MNRGGARSRTYPAVLDFPILAFVKADRLDRTVLAAHALAQDAITQWSDGRTVAAWVRFENGVTRAGIMGRMAADGGSGWNLRHFGPTTPDDARMSITDNASVLRQAVSGYAGGDMTSEWHAIQGDWSWPAASGSGAMVTRVDDDATAPISSGANGALVISDAYPVTLFWDLIGATPRPLAGKIARPVMLGVPDVAGIQADYFADAGKGRASSVWSHASLLAAPYPKAGTDGETCRVWPVDASGAEVTTGSLVLVGLPGPYAGAGESFFGDTTHDPDESYVKGSYPTPEGTAGMAVVMEITVDSNPGTIMVPFGKQSSPVLGGMRIAPQADVGNPQFDLLGWADSGALLINSQIACTSSYGTRLFVFVVIANDGRSMEARIIEADRTVTGTRSLSGFASDMGYAANFIFGRGRLTAGNTPFSLGQLHRLLVIPDTLTESEMQDIADGTTTVFAAGTIDISGFESNVQDDADTARGDGKRRLWGPLNSDRTDANESTIYDDVPTIEAIGTSITVGT